MAALQPILNASTVLNDNNAVDYLYGNGGRDWMLDFSLKDRFLDFNPNPTTGDRKN